MAGRRRALGSGPESIARVLNSAEIAQFALGRSTAVYARRCRAQADSARSDMYISTLRGFVEAMGGELQLVATFPDRPPVRLDASGAPRRKREKRTAASARNELVWSAPL